MKIIQDIIFAVLVIALNTVTFFLFNVNRKAKVDKKKLSVPFALILVVLIGLLVQNHARYIINFNSALALFFLMVARLAAYKLFSTHPEYNAKLKDMWSAFDVYVLPFFFIFFSVAQCVILILINLNE